MGLKDTIHGPILEVRWCYEDVMVKAQELGKKMTRAEAEEWLIRNAGALENAMVDFGWDAIKALL